MHQNAQDHAIWYMEKGKRGACKPRKSLKTARLGDDGPKQDPWVGYREIRQSYTQISRHISTTYIVTPARIYTVSINIMRAQRNDRLTFGVDGSQISVLEQGHKVGLSGLLKRHHSRGLEAKVSLHSKNVS
jgi:hypothetical protein